jgi:hypothetical protein
MSATMDKELCPKCKSAKTTLETIEGEQWWRCDFQGCEGRVSGAKYFWRPGQGLAPGSAPVGGGDDADEGDEAA